LGLRHRPNRLVGVHSLGVEAIESEEPEVRIRNTIAAVFLVAGWATTGAALIAHPVGSADSGSALLAMATHHRSELLTFAALYLLSAGLLVPGLVLISGLARRRGAVLLPVACIVLLIGCLGHAAESTMNMLLTAVAAIPADAAQKAAVLDSSAGMVAPVLVLAIVFDLALILFAVACWRARFTSFWPAVIVAAGVIGGNLVPGGRPVQVAVLAVMSFGIAWISLGVARHSAATEEPNPGTPHQAVVAASAVS
jgi:hypothetical protein